MDSRYNARRSRVKDHFKHGGRPKTRKDWERLERMGRPTRDRPSSNNSGDRRQNKATAEETLEILEKEFYVYTPEESSSDEPQDQMVDLKTSLRESHKATVEYTPAQSLTLTEFSVTEDDNPADPVYPTDPEQPTQYQVELETTLSGAQRLAEQGLNVAVLNFASARNPGGGFIKGSNAQEESLARSSGLYHCIKDCKMYQINEADNQKCIYSHQMIYSPGVPVFRDDDGDLLPPDEVYHVAFISAPAVNRGQAQRRVKNPNILDEVMYDRLDRILAVAKHHKHNAIVLGAYGCGVFGNDIETIGEMFYELLTEKYQGTFGVVLFSILGQEEYDTVKTVFEEELE